MTQIALIRHFPTAWNREGRLQGQSDIPLTEEARARLAGLAMPAPWDRASLVASPLSRAVETARILAAGRGVETDARLVELSFGEWEGRLAEELLRDPATGFRPTHLWSGTDRAPGGESLDEAWARVAPALADLAAGPRAVVVTHKALMRLILSRAGVAEPDIRRGRLYPLALAPDGAPRDPGAPVRLEAR